MQSDGARSEGDSTSQSTAKVGTGRPLRSASRAMAELRRALDERILAGEPLEAVSRELVHRLVQVLGAHSVRVLLLDHEAQKARVLGSLRARRSFVGGDLVPFEHLGDLLGPLAIRPALIFDDLEELEHPDALLQSSRIDGARSGLLVGFSLDGWLEGALLVTWPWVGVIPQHVEHVESAASLLALALRHERLRRHNESLRFELLAHASERGHEVKRARRLAVELGRVLGALDITRGPEHLLAQLGEELRGLGLGALVALHAPSGALQVTCSSFRPAVLAAVERGLGLPLVGLRVPYRAWNGEHDGMIPRAWWGEASVDMVSELVPSLEREVLKECLALVGFEPGTPFVVLPVLGRRRESGVLVAWGVSFLDELQQELAVFAMQLGSVLEAARWGARERRRRSRLEALRSVLAAVDMRFELPELLDDLLLGAVELLHAEHGLIALSADSGMELEVASVFGFGGPDPGVTLAYGDDIVGEVMRSRAPVAIRDYQAWQDPESTLEGPPWHAVLAVPLLFRGWLTGVLLLARSSDYVPFRRDDTGLLEAYGQHAALAIENARLFGRLKEMMSTDALTGLANRRELFARGELEIARAQRFGQTLSAIMLDLDRFKQLNDEHGHAVGDAALRTVGEAIIASCRSIDLAGRYGGEEFALLLPGTDLAGARLLAERVRSAIAASTEASEQIPCTVTASLGVAQAAPGEELAVLLGRADEALLVAKREGRDRVVVADPGDSK